MTYLHWHVLINLLYNVLYQTYICMTNICVTQSFTSSEVGEHV